MLSHSFRYCTPIKYYDFTTTIQLRVALALDVVQIVVAFAEKTGGHAGHDIQTDSMRSRPLIVGDLKKQSSLRLQTKTLLCLACVH